MDRWHGKVAVVTGASVGIGAAIAKDLVASGMKVVGLARRKEKMEELAAKMDTSQGGTFHPIKCDLEHENEILDAFEWIKNNLGGIDVLVNNAGIVRATMLSTPGNTSDLRKVLDVNVMAVCICTREAFNSMKDRGVAGHIIHINSLAGHTIPFVEPPTMNIYAGSKHCVTAMTEVFRQELVYLNNRTKITSISPGVVDTEIFESFIPADILEKFKCENPSLKPEDISQAVLYTLGTPEHVQVHEMIIHPVGEKF